MDTLSPTETALSRLASELSSLGYTAYVGENPGAPYYVRLFVAEARSLRTPDVREKEGPRKLSESARKSFPRGETVLSLGRERYYVWDGRAYRSPKSLAKTLATFLREGGTLPAREALSALFAFFAR